MTNSRQVRPADYGALPASVTSRSVEPGPEALPTTTDVDAPSRTPRPKQTQEGDR